MTWVILSEIFPTRIRGRAMAIATVCLWMANFVVSQTFPMMDENAWLVDTFHHAFPFWLYAAFCVVTIVFVVAGAGDQGPDAGRDREVVAVTTQFDLTGIQGTVTFRPAHRNCLRRSMSRHGFSSESFRRQCLQNLVGRTKWPGESRLPRAIFLISAPSEDRIPFPSARTSRAGC